MGIELTPGLLIVLASWVAGAVGTIFTKDTDALAPPLIVTVGWAAYYISQ